MTEERHIVARVEERMNHLEKVQEIHDKNLSDVCSTLKELRSTTDSFIRDIHRDIAAIRVELAKPQGVSWTLAFTLNIMSIIVTALIMYVVTEQGGGI